MKGGESLLSYLYNWAKAAAPVGREEAVDAVRFAADDKSEEERSPEQSLDEAEEECFLAESVINSSADSLLDATLPFVKGEGSCVVFLCCVGRKEGEDTTSSLFVARGTPAATSTISISMFSSIGSTAEREKAEEAFSSMNLS